MLYICLVGASVSEPHTSGFNAAFSLLLYVGRWTSYVVSKFAINISMFHLGFHTRRMRTRNAPRPAYPASQPHQLAGQRYCGRGERHGSQYALPVVIDCHPRLHRRWRPGYRQCVNANCQKQAEHIKCSLAELER